MHNATTIKHDIQNLVPASVNLVFLNWSTDKVMHNVASIVFYLTDFYSYNVCSTNLGLG